MPPRRRTTSIRTNARPAGSADASDAKTQARLRKIMITHNIPEDAVEIRFVMGDESSVVWFVERA